MTHNNFLSNPTLQDTFNLLQQLILYINDIYEVRGIEELAKITNPSINDLLLILDEIQKKIDPHKLNAVQAIILTKLLLTDIQSACNSASLEDCQSYKDQFLQLITSLSTINEKEMLI